MYRAIFAEYKDKIPMREFIETLSLQEKAELMAFIDKLIELKNNNNRISEKLSKFLRDGIFELRVSHLNRISRSLYFYQKDKTIVFTHGFIKKQDKTPNSEIEKAIKIRKIIG